MPEADFRKCFHREIDSHGYRFTVWQCLCICLKVRLPLVLLVGLSLALNIPDKIPIRITLPSKMDIRKAPILRQILL